jgi:hypothetical protein
MLGPTFEIADLVFSLGRNRHEVVTFLQVLHDSIVYGASNFDIGGLTLLEIWVEIVAEVSLEDKVLKEE